jgi:putative solute:sodium symporter small subunit
VRSGKVGAVNCEGGSEMSTQGDDYWRANIRLILKLLAIWFVVPFLGGIVFVDVLNQFRLGGYPLGFWIAQQGSIYLFVVIIFYYAKKMSDLDDHFLDETLDKEPTEKLGKESKEKLQQAKKQGGK